MFGSLRLVLALMVALAHAGVSLGGYHMGVPAVVGFYLLSGYVVASLLAPGSAMAERPLLFYAERALRLLPLYYFFALLGMIAWQVTASEPYLAVARPSIAQWLANLTIVPLNFFVFWPSLQQLVFVPPAWSLGLELQFYALAPWLLRHPHAMGAGIVATLAVQAAATQGLLDPDAYGYRLLCGTLFVFLAGAWLWRWRSGLSAGWPLVALWLAMAGLAVAAWANGNWGTPFLFEVQVGFLASLPLLALLSKLPRRRWDEAAGSLAYGVFLAHFPVMWLAAWLGWLEAARPLWLYLLLVLACSAIAHFAIERPLVGWRHRMRRPQRSPAHKQ